MFTSLMWTFLSVFSLLNNDDTYPLSQKVMAQIQIVITSTELVNLSELIIPLILLTSTSLEYFAILKKIHSVVFEIQLF